MSSKVTRPAVPPNSSTTIAMWFLRVRMSFKRFKIDKVSGTYWGEVMRSDGAGRGERFGAAQIRQEVAGVDEAAHVVDGFSVDGQAAVAVLGDERQDVR